MSALCIACSHICKKLFLCVRASPSPEAFTPRFEQWLLSGVEIMKQTFCFPTSVWSFVCFVLFCICILLSVFILKAFSECPMNFGSSIVTFPVCWIVFCLLGCCIPWLLILAGKALARGQSSLGDCVCLWRPSDEVLFQYVCCRSGHWWGALLCLSLPEPFGMWHVWPGVTLHLSLMFCLLLLTDYANWAPSHSPLCSFLPTGFTQGAWLQLSILPVGFGSLSQSCWLWNQALSRSPLPDLQQAH